MTRVTPQPAREACAGLGAAGRPLYAAWSGVDRPGDPLLQLWHAGLLPDWIRSRG